MSYVSILYLILLSISSTNGLTREEYDYVRGIVVDLIESSADREYDFVEGFVLVAFHDCVGGCDGTVRLETPQNHGIDRYITPLVDTYEAFNLSNIISRADFWMLAGAEAVLKGAQLAKEEDDSRVLSDVVFRWGRTDYGPNAYTDRFSHFPNEYDGLLGVMNFFRDEFNIDIRETVALMGAHGLSRMRRENSRYTGFFSRRVNVLTNEYYIDMIDSSFNWTQVNSNPDPTAKPSMQWFRSNETRGPFPDDVQSLLNVDICMYKHIKLQDCGGVSGCPIANTCPEAISAQVVREYAADNNLWVREFSAVYTKMLDNGWTDDQLFDIPEPKK